MMSVYLEANQRLIDEQVTHINVLEAQYDALEIDQDDYENNADWSYGVLDGLQAAFDEMEKVEQELVVRVLAAYSEYGVEYS